MEPYKYSTGNELVKVARELAKNFSVYYVTYGDGWQRREFLEEGGIYGDEPVDLIKEYRNLTGLVPLMRKLVKGVLGDMNWELLGSAVQKFRVVTHVGATLSPWWDRESYYISSMRAEFGEQANSEWRSTCKLVLARNGLSNVLFSDEGDMKLVARLIEVILRTSDLPILCEVECAFYPSPRNGVYPKSYGDFIRRERMCYVLMSKLTQLEDLWHLVVEFARDPNLFEKSEKMGEMRMKMAA